MPANEIIPGIWVGDAASAGNVAFLRKNKINAIVNATNSIPCIIPKINYFRIPVSDPGPNKNFTNPNIYKMAVMLPSALNFIHNQRQTGNILIHCRAGIQRSAAVMVGYLMKYCHNSGHRISMEEAIRIVRQARPAVFYWGNYINFKDALLHLKRYHL